MPSAAVCWPLSDRNKHLKLSWRRSSPFIRKQSSSKASAPELKASSSVPEVDGKKKEKQSTKNYDPTYQRSPGKEKIFEGEEARPKTQYITKTDKEISQLKEALIELSTANAAISSALIATQMMVQQLQQKSSIPPIASAPTKTMPASPSQPECDKRNDPEYCVLGDVSNAPPPPPAKAGVNSEVEIEPKAEIPKTPSLGSNVIPGERY
ncbi:hypothetical protein QR680_018117 [Steinernema hermaphroditum]|uniref:Uncharacterized protein n=1 Tax=Steinernema hermaphroditum TaxID=289476 RepID=A0AA39HJA8_9BILA|nr:hypothetical protein QR680_018117 [Steinernema hermaphroditum]